jgi:LmbE family N-acetylglucosaminyl deacetylase
VAAGSDSARRVVFAVAAHPDDIEFMMGGTVIRLHQLGWRVHMMTIGNGSCGTDRLSRDEIIRIRTEETRQSGARVNATVHPPLVNDAEIFYEREMLFRLGATVREVEPDILLLQSPEDYMEDHMYSSRLMVTAAFCRTMPNFPTEPPRPPIAKPVALYHSLPYGLQDQLYRPVVPDLFVDVTDVLGEKRAMLACHRSQKEWLDHSQGLDSYLTTMETMTAQVGRMSGEFEYAEGWRRHLHLGFCDEGYDPLTDALGERVVYRIP